jgi:hypothetical protein
MHQNNGNIVFYKMLRRKLVKIAENCDEIDPYLRNNNFPYDIIGTALRHLTGLVARHKYVSLLCNHSLRSIIRFKMSTNEPSKNTWGSFN